MDPELQVIVLAAGAPPSGETVATGARRFDRGRTVLEWQLHALRQFSQDVQVVLGYDLQVAQDALRSVRVRLNPDWHSTGSVASLQSCEIDVSRPLLVCYGDLLFREAAVEALLAGKAEMRVAIDSELLARARPTRESAILKGESVRFGTLEELGRADAFVCGLFWFSPVAAARIRSLDLAQANLGKAHMSRLLDWLGRDSALSIQFVETGAHVVDLDEERAVSRFVFGTKAQTLARLEDRITRGRVMPQISFPAKSWPACQDEMVGSVLSRFPDRRLIVRSSAASEDQFSGSAAGRFQSVLNVDAEKGALESAMRSVIGSFGDEVDASVLVQPMVTDVAISGVVLTRTLGRGAPYYVINFTEGEATDLVTGGKVLPKRAYMHRDASLEVLAEPLRPVIELVQEVERLTDLDALDLEFAVDAGGVSYLLQVRPLATSTDHDANTDRTVAEAIARARAEYRHLAANPERALGTRAVFGVMPDWNPAEIIGEVPSPLAFDLYRELVTDWAWARQRAEFGYRDLRGQPLLHGFCGRPYVDVRASFTSFVPASLPDGLAARLVESALQRLVEHPELHDKVEFDVMPTCLDFSFERWSEHVFRPAGLDAREIASIEAAYRDITVRAWAQVKVSTEAIRRYSDSLDGTQDPAWRRLSVSGVLHSCRDAAVLHFAHLARCAFVAVSLLRTAVSNGYLSQQRADAFLASVHTVSHEFRKHLHDAARGRMTTQELLDRYGHLRPGTYDVTIPSYSEAPDAMLLPMLQSISDPIDNGFAWTSEEERILADALRNAGLPDEPARFSDFLRASIQGREYGKFVFSRVLSSFLSWVRREAEACGLTPGDAACLTLGDINSWMRGAPALPPKDMLLGRISSARRAMLISQMLELPQLIHNHEHFSGHAATSARPNFVAHGLVVAPPLQLSGYSAQALAGRIVLIESADPGYDWIFAHGLAGLVTAYGGANSHMAIRCAELGLPAAIGVGPLLFKLAAGAEILRLDCDSRIVEVVQ